MLSTKSGIGDMILISRVTDGAGAWGKSCLQTLMGFGHFITYFKIFNGNSQAGGVKRALPQEYKRTQLPWRAIYQEP